MTTLTLQVTEVRFDFDDEDFTLEEQQAVVDDVLGNVFEVEVDDDGDDDEVLNKQNGTHSTTTQRIC
jgi:hypothetical protein